MAMDGQNRQDKDNASKVKAEKNFYMTKQKMLKIWKFSKSFR